MLAHGRDAEGKLRVYRTRNAGGSWEALTRGLPQKSALETVLRDAMAADPLNPAGIYFGTRSGQLWSSANGGAAWTLTASGLPPIVCVKAALVGEPKGSRAGGTNRRRAKRGPGQSKARTSAKPGRRAARKPRRKAARKPRPRTKKK